VTVSRTAGFVAMVAGARDACMVKMQYRSMVVTATKRVGYIVYLGSALASYQILSIIEQFSATNMVSRKNRVAIT
jgi:hypothetical protein